MDLKYSIILKIGLPVVAVVFLLIHLLKRKVLFCGGVRAANTKYSKKLPQYKIRKILNIIVMIICETALISSIVASLFLAARPYKVDTITKGEKKRDIFLCMDVSYSLCDLNYDLVNSLKQVVSNLDGDRFGISIFNTSTVLYVPMTDDYDFINDSLDKLENYFSLQKEFMNTYGNQQYVEDWQMTDYNKLEAELNQYEAGTLVNNYKKGSSLVGEGLASCLYNFPKLDDEERTRLVIMSTDNSQEKLAEPLVELPKAADLCKKYDVKIFGIFPNEDSWSWLNTTDYDSDYREFKTAVGKTGGKVYKQSETLSVKDIVNKIQKEEAKEVGTLTVSEEVDQPKWFVVWLIVSFAIFIAAEAVRL